MLVHLLTDEPTKVPAIRAMLEPQHRVVSQLLGNSGTQIQPDCVLMVDADLRKNIRVEQIKQVLQELSCISEKLFVVQDHVRSIVAQAYALGATAVVSRPRDIISKLAQIDGAKKTAQGD